MTIKNNNLLFRQAQCEDVDACWNIVRGAKAMMNRLGRNQWQGEYPSVRDVEKDIEHQCAMILLCEREPIAYGALIFTGEKSYDIITDGDWLTKTNTANCRYATLHRLAVEPEHMGKGLAQAFFEKALVEVGRRVFESMRVDTNYDNDMMLHILPKMGFTRCGIVQLPGGERIAFEKLV